MPNLFKITRNGKRSACWHGKVRDGGRWQRVRLFTDMTASTRRLHDLQRDADQRAAGVVTPQMRHAGRPIVEHVADYLAAHRLKGVKPNTHAITANLLRRLVRECGWRTLADLTADGLRAFVTRLIDGGRTTSYGNKFVNTAKAFTNWLAQDQRLATNPLASVRRGNEATAAKNRARRPLDADELIDLLTHDRPDTGRNAWQRDALRRRQAAYAFAVYAGLRRGELADLRWGDLRLNAPIPFIQLRAEQTKNAKADALPLHPYLIAVLAGTTPGDDADAVVATVPDVKTIKKDLARCGIPFADKRGRRADFHALRHTLSTLLCEAGCSDVVRKALTRHADTTVNDGYTHARLREMADALGRLPSPLDAGREQAGVRATGTTGRDGGDHMRDHGGPNTAPNAGPRPAFSGGDRPKIGVASAARSAPQIRVSGGLALALAATGVDRHRGPPTLSGSRPDARAD